MTAFDATLLRLNTTQQHHMYAKLFAQIYDGTLCTKGPWQALVTFQQMLVLADLDGNVDMTAGAIARRTTVPLEIIELGIACLLLPDPESRTPAEDGRRIVPLAENRTWGWRIVNYAHYRDMKKEEDRRAYHREYWRQHRSSTASTSTQHTQPIQIQATDTAKAKEKKERKPAKEPALRVPLWSPPEWVPADKWAAFVAMRKAKGSRAPFTEAAREGIIAALDKLRADGHNVGEVLQASVVNGWSGVFAPKSVPNGKVSQPADLSDMFRRGSA